MNSVFCVCGFKTEYSVSKPRCCGGCGQPFDVTFKRPNPSSPQPITPTAPHFVPDVPAQARQIYQPVPQYQQPPPQQYPSYYYPQEPEPITFNPDDFVNLEPKEPREAKLTIGAVQNTDISYLTSRPQGEVRGPNGRTLNMVYNDYMSATPSVASTDVKLPVKPSQAPRNASASPAAPSVPSTSAKPRRSRKA